MSLAELKSPHAEPPLLALVDHESAAVRIAAWRGLRNLRVEASLAPGLKALSDPDARVRCEAVGALAYLKYEATLPALIGAAKDANFEVRRAATAALAFATPERTTPTILAGLADAHWQVREAAALLAGKIKAEGRSQALSTRFRTRPGRWAAKLPLRWDSSRPPAPSRR